MNYFFEHHDQLWYLIAGLSFVIELSVMGLSGPLLFFAIGSLLTGVLASLGLVTTWQMEVFAVGILSAITAVILWTPLKKLQNLKNKNNNSSDMIGLNVPASAEITEHQGNVRYSGVDWNARLAKECHVECIAINTRCEIVAISGTTMIVKPLD